MERGGLEERGVPEESIGGTAEGNSRKGEPLYISKERKEKHWDRGEKRKLGRGRGATDRRSCSRVVTRPCR